MGIQINGQTDTISATDGSLNIAGTVAVNVTGDATGLTGTPNITVGVITASSAVISGDLTVNGTTTTLDTIVTEVDKLEVGANNTNVAVAITQSGSGDILRLYDGASRVVTVADGGNIGIGSETPQASLDIAKTTPVIRFTDTDAGQYAELLNSGSSFYISADRGNGGNGDIIFRSGGTSEKVRIKSDGKVGIGTDNPTRKLDVEIQTASGALGSVLNSHPIAEFINLSAGAARGLEIGAPPDGFLSPVYLKVSGTSSRFAILDASNDENFTILESGNVGIGTDNPQTHLHVFDASSTGRIRIQGGGVSSAQLQLIGGGQSDPFVITQDPSRNLVFYDHANERLRIDSSGRFLYGTGSSGGYALFDNSTTNPKFQFRQTSGEPRGAAFIEDRNDAFGFDIYISKSRGIGTSVLSSGDQLGKIWFTGADGTNQVAGAGIIASVSGSPGNDNMPTSLLFETNSGTSGTTERMRIRSDGAVVIGDGTTWDKYVSDAVFQITHNTNAKLVLNNPGNSTYSLAVGTDNNLSFRNESQSTTPLTIEYSTNNIGIGTANPGQKLEVNGAIKVHTGSSTQGAQMLVLPHVDVTLASNSSATLNLGSRFTGMIVVSGYGNDTASGVWVVASASAYDVDSISRLLFRTHPAANTTDLTITSPSVGGVHQFQLNQTGTSTKTYKIVAFGIYG
jgi:hypothetical protein